MSYINYIEENKKCHRPWIKYYSDPQLADLEYPDISMYDVFEKTANDFPDAIALDYMNTKTSYRDLHQEILRTAKALQNQGIKSGDRVTVLPSAERLTLYS